ncbi:hypothetical protein G7Z17_g1101 [Cylindrodendrum hubeiense]|uniref:Uncharacterized protein n=1 Tax=Cylindrodendrum hubeiense TaxID=595255 RepID=A0A9P5HNH1_9HYPO|nr:hypothetical protein G7Z17_g1101 [Cylindrodendrum hubeiense]
MFASAFCNKQTIDTPSSLWGFLRHHPARSSPNMDPETKARKMAHLASQLHCNVPGVKFTVKPINESDFGAVTLVTDGDKGNFATEIELPDGSLGRFLDAFSLWICNGAAVDRLGRPKYLELAFREVQEESLAKRVAGFWKKTLDYPELKALDLHYNVIPTRHVYIAADLAHPGGYIVTSIMSRSASALALYVMFYGLSNPRMCECCARKYRTTITASKEHVLSPFPNCVSHTDIAGATCANCIWEGHEDCTWKFLSGYVQAMRLRGLPDQPTAENSQQQVGNATVPIIPDALNIESCPRVTCKLTGLPLSRKEKEAAVKEAREILESQKRALSDEQ